MDLNCCLDLLVLVIDVSLFFMHDKPKKSGPLSMYLIQISYTKSQELCQRPVIFVGVIYYHNN